MHSLAKLSPLKSPRTLVAAGACLAACLVSSPPLFADDTGGYFDGHHSAIAKMMIKVLIIATIETKLAPSFISTWKTIISLSPLLTPAPRIRYSVLPPRLISTA